ncbi:MAG: 4-hydroxy-3-methylbut-2-enyl diphosphate reductase [Planctomycetaceae bacterium]|nr:4-hydroxy-3-methylbut-2-enyl diphosphate reductase [Planctomycetaceae bacterium]
MKLILANPRGFCAGVHMAIAVVDELIGIFPDETICVYHEIVHNRHVVERFKEQGVIFVESIGDAPDGSVVVFSAHGISPAIRAEAQARDLVTIDATCPLVTKVHAEAIRYSRRGYQIVLIGHANHQEVIGTRGEAPDAIQIVETPDDIPGLQIDDPEKVVYLTQTTLSTDDADVVINALKEAIPTIQAPPSGDICYATTNRQNAVRAIAPHCDLVLVVGSRNSSNSVRLTEISQNVGTPAQLLDDKSELLDEWFDGVETVMITAGASAPEDLVNDLILHLVEIHGGEVEQWDIDRETVSFGLPREMKKLMRSRGLDPLGRTLTVDGAGDLDRLLDEHDIPHRTIDLTIGASE